MIRKILLASCILLMCIAISSCSWFSKSEDEYGVFFSDSILQNRRISNVPLPNMDRSLMRSGRLYLNLTDEEYLDYINELADFFTAIENVYDLSLILQIKRSSFFFSDCFYTPYDIRILDMVKSDFVGFLYHDRKYASYPFEEIDPFEFYIERYDTEQSMKNTDFKYNTCIDITCGSYFFKPISCPYGHTYGEEKEYIVPGEDRTVMSAKCTVCGIDSISEELFADKDRIEYLITDRMIFEKAEKCTLSFARDEYALYTDDGNEVQTKFRADGICEVKIKNEEGIEPLISVNGTEIPKGEVHEEYTSYYFASPGESAEVVIRLFKDGKPVNIYLGDIFPWICELKDEDIEKVSYRSTDVSDPLFAYLRYTTYSMGSQYFTGLSERIIKKAYKGDDVLNTGTLSVYTEDGRVFEINIIYGLLFDGTDYYLIRGSFSMNEGGVDHTMYSLETDTGEGTVLDADGKELGKISSVNEFEFERCEGAGYADLKAIYTIKADSLEIFAVSDTVFYICDRYGERHWFRLNNTDFNAIMDECQK